MDSTTQILEILVIVLVSIEVVELYFNMRVIRTHEKELNGHVTKLEQYSSKIDTFMNLVNQLNGQINQLDAHVKTLDNLLRKERQTD
jgi:conjugal transfer/entry exclusion protein